MNLAKLMKTTALLIGSCCAVCFLSVGMESNNKPSYLCQECWGSYIQTWEEWKNIDKKFANIHKEMASRVELGIEKDIGKFEGSNIAAFAISIELQNDILYGQLPFVIASCRVSPSEVLYDYWQKDKQYIPLISINDFFQKEFLYSFSTVEATKAFVSRTIGVLKLKENQCCGIKKEQEQTTSWALEKALGLLDKRVESGKYLDHLIDPAGTESGEENDILRSVLHCEQVVLDRIMNDDNFLNLFLRQLKKEKVNDQEIVSLNFHIDTYLDMCPKCFSIFRYRKENLKKRVYEALFGSEYYETQEQRLKFRLLISSHKEYQIQETKYKTGNNTGETKSKEDVLQFRVGKTEIEGIKEHISKVYNEKVKKCKKIDELFEVINSILAIGQHKSSSVQVPEKRYREQIEAIKKVQSRKNKKEISENKNENVKNIMVAVVESKNKYLAECEKAVNDILKTIEEKIAELSKITYFPFPEQK